MIVIVGIIDLCVIGVVYYNSNYMELWCFVCEKKKLIKGNIV